ncbi:hypothetical protein E4N70_00355 [Treponema vincentii]|uniref:hypothetical protein n=1 Tax=Treponema vincentii TaxID=69710 RepID=UPI0020A2FF55|nr:hypothetical protein [Treponema vincentii]UTC60084.1 hypothetical protein E4N70_00355 [Treponema vincentii]
MKCICCFFDSNYQKELKEKTFGIERFEDKLETYKKYYINDLKTLAPISKCNCNSRSNNKLFEKWTNDFSQNIQANIKEAEDTFDEFIKIYKLHISRSQKQSIDEMWNYMNSNNLITGSETPIDYIQVLFRGRKKPSEIDISNPNSFFHIPFNKRKYITNQRFSISGQPMLYFGKSIVCIAKELDSKVEDLSFGSYLPNYSAYYNKKIYTLKNQFFDTLKTLKVLVKSGGQIDYNDSRIAPNKNTITRDIQKSIISEILMFPVEEKKFFIEEYVLPQILTAILMEKNYDGIIYPSTKNYSDIDNPDENTDYNLNLALFVNYNQNSNYDENLLKTFYPVLLNTTTIKKLKPNDIINGMERVFTLTKSSNNNNNDFILPIVKAKRQIENMQKMKLNGISYYDTEEGLIELNFYEKLINVILPLIK